MSLFLASIVLLLLLLEGFAFSVCILGWKTFRPLQAALALPLAALANVILTALYTIFTVPFTPWSLLGGHIVIVILAGIYWHRWPKPSIAILAHTPSFMPPKIRWSIRTACGLILLGLFIYSFAHAVILPSFQADSFSNWTMRSKISFMDREIAFDRTEARGLAKPQYPFLLHSLQITANQLHSTWSDRVANTITFLLTLTSFITLYFLLRMLKGRTYSLLGVTLVLTIPLLGVHLSQGYGDIHLIQYLLLSLATLFLWQRTHDRRWFLLSALFVAAAVWTKSEGWIVGLFPWLFVTGLLLWKDKRRIYKALPSIIIALVISALFPIILAIEGLGFTPHGSDFSIGFYPDAAAELFPAIFLRGSFGLTWYLLPVALFLLMWKGLKRDPQIDSRMASGIVWGALTLLIVLFTYTFTPNAQFLLNGESFYRQMMIPSAMLILTCVSMWRPARMD